jgi:hypothetical protein
MDYTQAQQLQVTTPKIFFLSLEHPSKNKFTEEGPFRHSTKGYICPDTITLLQ